MRADSMPPRIEASPHSQYFLQLQSALREAGLAWPVLVLDRGRLYRNVERLRALLGPQQRLRLVEKSLPVPALLAEVMARLSTDALMVFHEPQLRQVVNDFPQADILIGKPLPVAAARHFHQWVAMQGAAQPPCIQWLVDTPQRLADYAALAQELGIRLDVNIEIDVGLHRGGVEDAQGMDQMLHVIHARSAQLRLTGLMGYDAHVGKLPQFVQSRRTGFDRAVSAYRAFQTQVCESFPGLSAQACWNGAGSPTVALHGDGHSPLNDVSVGSALLKPCDFDIDLLAEFEPALFVATPVLKRLRSVRLPGPGWFSRLVMGWQGRNRCTYYVYGGGWPAKVASPPMLKRPGIYGTSYNQAIYLGARRPALAVDDYLFLRPHQSEGTLLHFGPVCIYDDGRIVDRWAPYAEG